MRTTKTKKKTESTPVSVCFVQDENSSSYIRVKAFLERHNTELDTETRRYFDEFHLGEGTVVRDINNEIVAINYHGVGKWDALYIGADGRCSLSQSIFGGF